MTLADLLEPLLPTTCAVCRLPGERLCLSCRGRLQPLTGPWCAGCGRPLAVATPRCPECVGPLVGARQALVYSEASAGLIRALKDRGQPALAPLLAGLIVAELPPPALGAVLVPVPADPRRRRRRGLDHTHLLARALSQRWQRPLVRALERRPGPAQRGADRAGRLRQTRGTIVLRAAAPRHPLLVDDVRTTGATLAECARVLRAAGSRRIGAVCVARAERGDPLRGHPHQR